MKAATGGAVSITRSSRQERGVPKKLGIASLTGKILCVEHNGKLSPLDSVGKKMFVSMEDIHYGCRTPDAREKSAE